MRYKIKDIPSEGLLVQLELPRALFADALEGMEADLAATTGNLRVELTKDRDENVFARGDVKALVTLPCASCLGPALVKIDAPLKMTFVADLDDEAGSEDPLDVVREQIILGIPMSARCRDNCAGLCTVCGQNKNERDCGHKPPGLEDPRFAALKNLKLE